MNVVSHLADKFMGQKITSTPMKPKLDETRTMGSLVWKGKKDIQYKQMPRPLLTDSTDVILKITATTICGSDLHLYTNAMLDMHEDDILGHEFMGIIEEVGTDVKNLQVGQRVVVAFDIACGKCDYCKREEYTACDTTNPSKLMESMYGHRSASLYGYSHLTGGVPGGQADYVRVPFADVNCLPIPVDVPDEKALYLSDVVPTAYHGVELADVKKGSTVAIWGLGPIGLIAARWAQLRGASRIIGIDCVEERLRMAKEVIGIETINFKEKDTCKTLFEMVPGGLDCTIECAGFEYSTSMLHKVERMVGLETDTSDILSEMIYTTRKFGNISIIGVYSGYTNHFPIGAMMEKGLTVRGGQSPTQKYWKMALEKIRSGEMDPTFIVTHREKLSEGAKLYDRFYDKDKVIKVFLRPDHLFLESNTVPQGKSVQ
jgi:threonine dehydrogenase-like Zn-dependent dehydrogenase